MLSPNTMRKATVAARLAKLEAGNTKSLTSWESLFLWTSQVTFKNQKLCRSSEKETFFFFLDKLIKTWTLTSKAKAKPDYVDTFYSLRVLFMKQWHPLSCMHIQKETSLNLYVLERGREVEMGAWSFLIISFCSQVKKQQLRFSRHFECSGWVFSIALEVEFY